MNRGAAKSGDGGSRGNEYRYELCIACLFQDEAPYLMEWIEFHRMMGVEHFLLVNDRSSDDFETILQPFVDQGIVSLQTWHCPEEYRGKGWIQYQHNAFRRFVECFRGITRWLALIDVDEFIVPVSHDTAAEFLRYRHDADGLYLRWEPFGTSYIQQIPDSRLLIESLYLKDRFRKGRDMLGKSIVKPHKVSDANVHRCALVPGAVYWDSNPDMQCSETEISLHHYWSRDEQFLFGTKLPRTVEIKGWTLDDELIEYFRNLFNEVPDHSMQRFVPELRRRVFGDAPASRQRGNLE